MGKIATSTKKPHTLDQFPVVDDNKLKMALAAIADRYDEAKRTKIYKTYNDPQLMMIYRGIRNSGINKREGTIKGAGHHKILEFPDADIADFVDTNMKALYGPEWLQNNKALNHELVRPWWVVDKI